ncbi:MAG: hypothetical protein PVG66_12930 [Chromatiales bacterium]|jgi:hypothetical protein
MNGSLFLSPANPFASNDNTQNLEALLREQGLIDQPWQGHENSYLCGENFLQQITFMGCSPYLEFSPPSDGRDNFCHVILHHYEHCRMFSGRQTAPPRCPSCRYRIAEWRDLLQQHDVADEQQLWTCPKCAEQYHPARLDWRQNAGAGKLLVEIRNIFPGEAVPVDSLLLKLGKLTDERKWRYFYLT